MLLARVVHLKVHLDQQLCTSSAEYGVLPNTESHAAGKPPDALLQGRLFVSY